MSKFIFKIINEKEIESKIDEFLQKKLFFNNYFNVNLSDVEFFETDFSLLIRKAYQGFYRLYILSVSESDLIEILKEIEEKHAVNIPTKKDISDWQRLLEYSGFKLFATYIRHTNKKEFVKKGDLYDFYANPSDFEEIKTTLYQTFSPITGWLPNDEELSLKIENQQIMVNRDDEGLSGLIIYTINNRKADLNAWVGKRGQGIYLFLNMFNLLAERNVRSAYAWINSENLKVLKIYRIMGFEPDGLQDYTFLK